MNTKSKQISESEKLYAELKELSERYFAKYIQDTDCYDFADSYFEPRPTSEPIEKKGDPERIMPFLLRKEVWEFFKLFKELVIQSQADNFFWRYCPFSVYKDHLYRRGQEYISCHIDSTSRDFYIADLIDICEPAEEIQSQMRGLKYDFSNFNLLPERTIIEGNVFPPTKFASEKFFYFNEINQTIQKRKVEYLIRLLSNDFQDVQTRYSEGREDFRDIFANYGYELFCYLDENYVTDNNSPKAKYSFLYHFLVTEGYILGRMQTRYINAIGKYLEVKLSKIQSTNYKYDTEIKTKLTSYLKLFKQNKPY